ncbi:adaptor-related protein complex 2, alpha subunit, partial [Reticulomyxa filosa]
EERERVDKELAKIRAAFDKPSKDLKTHAQRKYMWKIMYMYILGYSVDIGHIQCVDLIRSQKFAEKQVGYVAVSLLLIEHTEMLRLCIQTIKNDLASPNEVFQSLALTCIANVGGVEFAEALTSDVQRLLVSGTSLAFVRKKAALCLLRLLRQYPDNLPPAELAPDIIRLAEQKNIGVVTSVVSLLTGLATYDTATYTNVVPLVVRLLATLIVDRQCNKEYIYYRTPDPWLQIKLLRLLQFFPPPLSDKITLDKLQNILDTILGKTEVTQSVNKNHADHAILFEAMNVIIHLNLHDLDILHERAVNKLLHFISVKESNIRYLGLDTMSRLAKLPKTHRTIKRHLRTIQFSLDDSDISIRKRALDLLYSICDSSNVEEILEHLLKYLSKAEYQMREDMVLKIAILAEKFATNMEWYINIVLQLLTIAGDFVAEDVWHRVIQIVTNDESLQKYAAEMVFKNLQNPPVHESLLKTGGYILGEFGHLLDTDGKQQFEVLHKHFQSSTIVTKALLLSTYMKFANLYEDLAPTIVTIFQSFRTSVDTELQQRAIEYDAMASYQNQSLISGVWDAMPDFPERESNLMKIVRKKEGAGVGRDVQSDTDNDTVTTKGVDGNKEEAEAEEEAEEGEPKPEAKNTTTRRSDEGIGYNIQSNANKDSTSSKPTPGGQSQQQQQHQQSDILDLFGMGGDDFGVLAVTTPNPSTKSNKIKELKQERKLWRKLFMLHSALLYEDSMLQIGIKSQIESETGVMRVILFYGNKSNSPIEAVSMDVKKVEGVELEISPTEPFDIDAQQQMQQKCRVSLLQPPAAVPSALISFTCKGEQYRIEAQFPAIVTKFFSAYPIEASQFRQRWEQVPKEEKQVIRITGDSVSSSDLKKILSDSLSIGLIEGIDKNPDNSVGCSRLTFATKKQGKNITFPVLLRVEFNEPKQALRVTARTPHEAATKAVIQALQCIFEN